MSLRECEQRTGTLVDEERTYTTCHTANTSDGSDSRFREHVADGREEVCRPSLMSCTSETNDYCWPPSRHCAERLGEESQQREEGEDKHREHTSAVWVHSLLLNEELWQIATIDRQYGNNCVESEYEHYCLRRARLVAILVGEISRSPE